MSMSVSTNNSVNKDDDEEGSLFDLRMRYNLIRLQQEGQLTDVQKRAFTHMCVMIEEQHKVEMDREWEDGFFTPNVWAFIKSVVTPEDGKVDMTSVMMQCRKQVIDESSVKEQA